MDSSIDTLKRYQRYFKRLIKLEREEEISFHWDEITTISGIQREKKGRAVLQLSGRDAGRGLGGIFLVKFVRSDGLPDTEISNGDLVIVSTGTPDGAEATAVVTEKTNFSITVAYNNTPPAHVYGRNLRLDLFANDITFQRMLDALFSLRDHQPITELLLLQRIPEETEALPEVDFVQDILNASQKRTVVSAMAAPEVFLIHGPPGTGKTTTLVEVILQHIKNGKKVLATADSNTAVDNLVEKLVRHPFRVIRIGNPARLNPDLAAVSLDHLVQEEDHYQQAVVLRDKIAQMRKDQRQFVPPSGQNRRGLGDAAILRLAKKGGSSRGVPVHKIRKMAGWISLQQKINGWMDQVKALEEKAVRHLIENCDVVCSTNVSAGGEVLHDFRFHVAVIDEATQSMEPSCLIPMTKAGKWILAGDHRQLQPTVLSDEARELNFTLFERWIEAFKGHAKLMLKVQYRMHEAIMAFSNTAFYDGKLKASPKVKKHHIGQLSGFQSPPFMSESQQGIVDPSIPLCFIDVANGREEKIPGSFSYFNLAEVEQTVKTVELLMSIRLFPSDIGIISPYHQQVNLLKGRLGAEGIEIKTVDGFQGREKEVIVLSLVRANEKGSLGFLTDYRRLNVSVTRAKRKLIIIGHEDTLLQDPMYAKLLSGIDCKITL